MNGYGRTFLAGCLAAVLAAAARADYKDDIGYNRLAAELGASLPTGAGIPVSQVEGYTDYMPDTNTAEFAGKTFVNMTDTSTTAWWHATSVGAYFYGANTSIAPGISNINVYEASDWLGSGFLKFGTSSAPSNETQRIQNHSWISGIETNLWVISNIVRRLDYAIVRDGFTALVGMNNGSSTSIPAYPSHSYNAISIGRSDGEHSHGFTEVDEAGRIKPDIVAPILSGTSFCLPVVGAASAMLMQKALGEPALGNAVKPECIRALLMAGATKDEFPGWARTPARPLDWVYGAGELNIFNSYHVLVGGEQAPSPTNAVQPMGWNYTNGIPGTTNSYFFQVASNQAMTRLSALLAWNRIVTDAPGGGFDPEAFVPNLSLSLYAATNYVRAGLVDISTSAVDNAEHIYVRGLGQGQYVMDVVSDSTSSYALAWFSQTALVPVMDGIWQTGGNVRVQSTVSSNVPYALQASTNLLDAGAWTAVATNTSVSNLFIHVDTAASNFTQRFYRLVADP